MLNKKLGDLYISESEDDESKDYSETLHFFHAEISYYTKITNEQISTLIEEAKKNSIAEFVVGGVILNDQHKALLVKRSEKEIFLPNILEFPSGHLEEGENLVEGLVREVKEETSYEDIFVSEYINYFDYISRSNKQVRQFNFLVKLNCHKEPILNKKEHQNYYWCNYEQAFDIGADETVLRCLKMISNIDLLSNKS